MKYFFLALLLALSGCATQHPLKSPPQPPSPDTAIVRIPIVRAAESTKKVVSHVAAAKSAAERGVQIVEKLVPTAGQEAEIAQLKLELSTTVQELTLANERIASVLAALGEAIAKSQKLQVDFDNMQDWGVAQQSRADNLQAKLNIVNLKYQRLEFITAAVIAMAVFLLVFFFSKGSLNPLYAIGLPAGAAAVAFGLAYVVL